MIVPSDPTSAHSPPPDAAIETFTSRSGPIPDANSDTSPHSDSQDFMLLSNTLAFSVHDLTIVGASPRLDYVESTE